MKIIKYCIYIIFLIAITTSPIMAQRRKIDSLLTLIKTDKEDTNKVKHYLKLYFQYAPKDDYDTCLLYLHKGLAVAEKIKVGSEIGWKKGIGHCHNNIGISLMRLGNYAEAFVHYLAAKKKYEEINYTEGLGLVTNNIGLIYNEYGDYADAVKYYYTSLKFMEQQKDEGGISMVCFNLGTSFHWLQNDSAALANLNRAQKINIKFDLKEDLALAYNTIGIIYDAQGKYTEALDNFSKAVKINTDENDRDNLALNYNNIGLVYGRQHKFKEALNIYQLSINLFEKLDSKSGLMNCFRNIGDLYKDMHQMEQASLYLNKSLQLSIAMRKKGDISKAYYGLMELDTLNGNYKGAFRNRVLYDMYQDSLVNEENNRKVLQTTMQYDFDKKEADTKFASDKIVSDLENQNKLQKQKQLFLVVFIAVFIVLVIIVLFFAKRAYDNKKKYSDVLSKENEHKELLLREVHHRVNNSLQMISSLLSIQADTTTNEEIREYLLKSENRIQAMSTMHHLLHMGNSKLEVNIQHYLGEIIKFYSNVLESKPAIKLYIEIPSVNFHTKTALPLALLLNELLTNSIKYAFPNDEGEIRISLNQLNNTSQWNLKIGDNGIGFIEGDVGGKGTSLGLSLVKLMSRQIGGNLNINHDSGTSFELIFSETPV